MIKKIISKLFGFEKEIKALKIKNELRENELKTAEKALKKAENKIKDLESKIVTLKKKSQQKPLSKQKQSPSRQTNKAQSNCSTEKSRS